MTHPQPDPFRALRASDGPVDPDPAFAAALRARVERALLWEEPMTSTLTPPRTAPRMHTLTPYLAVVDARASIAFYVAAFGAVRRGDPHVMPDGRIGHVEVGIGDTVLMLADEFPEMGFRSPQTLGGSPVMLHIYVPDVDALIKQAVAAGAKVKQPVENKFYGDRAGGVEDPFGHSWFFATHVEDVPPDELQRRAAKMHGGA